jgi:hypothetical protein
VLVENTNGIIPTSRVINPYPYGHELHQRPSRTYLMSEQVEFCAGPQATEQADLKVNQELR